MPTPTKTPFMQLNTSPIQGSQLQEVYAEHSLEHETKLDNLHHFISLFDRLQQEVTTPLYAIGSKSRSRIKQHISDARSSETMHLHRIHGEAVMRNIWTKMGSLATSFDDTIRTNVTSQTQDSDSRDRTDLNLPYAANLRDVHTPTLYESGRVSPVGLDTFQPAMRSIGLIFADRGPSPQDSSPDSVKDHPIVELNTMYKASTPAQLMSHRHSRYAALSLDFLFVYSRRSALRISLSSPIPML